MQLLGNLEQKKKIALNSSSYKVFFSSFSAITVASASIPTAINTLAHFDHFYLIAFLKFLRQSQQTKFD